MYRAGMKYYYVVTGVSAEFMESSYSSEGIAVIPAEKRHK